MPLNELDTLIPRYAQNKAELEGYKKICDTENAQIKAIMKEYALQHFETAGYKATYSVSTRETMNEERLLEIAHTYELNSIIKVKEYIDYDALEAALYNNAIPEEVILEMDKAKESKEVVTLRISKVKKGKEND